ncbi:uncharacterized protein LOC132553334 [Ylistrum balloti]|uniref:uncharacterized protein LOC132553334 n=1 Tax=Ylistrum balloti TaxID=509963 RepID=UPI0029058300|nr:uncharacterized protein LOC132553334 [Ylistrum balloti]
MVVGVSLLLNKGDFKSESEMILLLSREGTKSRSHRERKRRTRRLCLPDPWASMETESSPTTVLRCSCFRFSNFPTMKMNTRFSREMHDMYNVHGHAGNLCRESILDGINKIICSRSKCQSAQPISVADFGTADGVASLDLVKEIIATIQTELGKEQAIIVYYNDQPMNDFNLLSKVILGDGPGSGVMVTGNVYPMVIPRTMYKQCLPNNSLDLAMSSVATHYMSTQVCQIKDGVFVEEADDSEQRLMREQAKTDWRAFVISRGRELKPGGYLVTLNTSLDEKGNSPTLKDNGKVIMGDTVSELAKEGIITQEEYLGMNYNAYYVRSEEDFKEPFTSALPDVERLGLELVLIKHYLQSPLPDIVNKDETEKLEYSHKLVAMVYPWMYHVIYGGLSKSRTEEEKEMIIDQYFHRLQTYAFDHSDNKLYPSFTQVVIKKKIM